MFRESHKRGGCEWNLLALAALIRTSPLLDSQNLTAAGQHGPVGYVNRAAGSNYNSSWHEQLTRRELSASAIGLDFDLVSDAFRQSTGV